MTDSNETDSDIQEGDRVSVKFRVDGIEEDGNYRLKPEDGGDLAYWFRESELEPCEEQDD